MRNALKPERKARFYSSNINGTELNNIDHVFNCWMYTTSFFKTFNSGRLWFVVATCFKKHVWEVSSNIYKTEKVV